MREPATSVCRVSDGHGAFVRETGGVDGDGDATAALFALPAEGPGRRRPQGLFVRSPVSSGVAGSGAAAGAAADLSTCAAGAGGKRKPDTLGGWELSSDFARIRVFPEVGRLAVSFHRGHRC